MGRLLVRCILLVTIGSVGRVTLLHGQTSHASAQKPPAFEVASVKLNNSGTTRSLGGPKRGHFIQSGTLRQLIQAAYRRGGFDIRQVSGGPKWLDRDRFDIDATVSGDLSVAALYLPDAKGSAGLAYLMLRTLLADRFKLAIHTETQQRPIYALTSVRRDNALGPHLHKSDVDCDAVLAEIARTGHPAPPKARGHMPPCSTQTGPGHISANAISMSQLAEMLSGFAARETHDHTNLRGNFDVTLDWTPDTLPPRSVGASPDQPTAVNGATIDPNGPTLVTAIQEQLGLKLESTRGPVDVLVIDHVEKPTPD
jgi:uncharacterized protein (TIGR03435 family)